MRQITQQSIQAFMNNEPFKSGNMRVMPGKTTMLFLFGNLIAEKTKDTITITNAGWKSATTKERLNAIPGVRINQKKATWYLNGKEWDGKRIKI